MIIVMKLSFPKNSLSKMFFVHSKIMKKQTCSDFSGLKSLFEKLCFRDGDECEVLA